MPTSKKFQRLRVLTPALEKGKEREGTEDNASQWKGAAGTLFLSNNSKTGVSINAAIAHTCRPTPACSIYCYGLEGRIAMPAALRRQAENASLFNVDEDNWGQLADEAMDIAHVVSRQQDFLRMFGVGDLQPGSVYFINQLSCYAKLAKPKFRIWVSTRKFDLAANLVDNTNLHVMLSFDSSTPTRWRTEGLRLLAERRPQFFAAWVRQETGERVPPWVNVVFEMHRHGHGRAKRAGHPKACPATIHASFAGAEPLEGACARCQFCFDVKRRESTPLMTFKKRG